MNIYEAAKAAQEKGVAIANDDVMPHIVMYLAEDEFCVLFRPENPEYGWDKECWYPRGEDILSTDWRLTQITLSQILEWPCAKDLRENFLCKQSLDKKCTPAIKSRHFWARFLKSLRLPIRDK